MVLGSKRETQKYECRKDLPTKHSVRPWGVVALLVRNQKCSVDWTTVNPGHVTSLHPHNIREELWVILNRGCGSHSGRWSVASQNGEIKFS